MSRLSKEYFMKSSIAEKGSTKEESDEALGVYNYLKQ